MGPKFRYPSLPNDNQHSHAFGLNAVSCPLSYLYSIFSVPLIISTKIPEGIAQTRAEIIRNNNLQGSAKRDLFGPRYSEPFSSSDSLQIFHDNNPSGWVGTAEMPYPPSIPALVPTDMELIMRINGNALPAWLGGRKGPKDSNEQRQESFEHAMMKCATNILSDDWATRFGFNPFVDQNVSISMLHFDAPMHFIVVCGNPVKGLSHVDKADEGSSQSTLAASAESQMGMPLKAIIHSGQSLTDIVDDISQEEFNYLQKQVPGVYFQQLVTIFATGALVSSVEKLQQLIKVHFILPHQWGETVLRIQRDAIDLRLKFMQEVGRERD